MISALLGIAALLFAVRIFRSAMAQRWLASRFDAAGGLGNLALNFSWFIFVVVMVGQMGPILVIAAGLWRTGNLLEFIDERAGNGEFILCSTAILAGAAYFIVKEYSSNKILAGGRNLKSWGILLSVLFALWGVVLASGLLINPGFERFFQRVVHWFVYSCSILLSFFLWFIEYSEQSATEAVRAYVEESMDMTASSRQDSAGDIKL